MVVVTARADEGAYLMQNGRHFEQQAVMAVEPVQLFQLVKEADAQLADVAAVTAIRAVAVCQQLGKVN